MAKKRKPLVCQHLESLSSAMLERYAPLIREMVGRRHGVYALYKRDRLYYVGLATNLRGRLNAHLKDRHKGLWDRFSVYLTIEDGHTKELESLVLRIVQPEGNKQRGTLARSENLARVLTERVRERQRQELRSLLGRRMPEAKKRSRKPTSRSGQTPLARYVSSPLKIRARLNGRVIRAVVRRDGQIRHNGVLYKAPSDAASAITGERTNGWTFWSFERAPGQWLWLRELKRR